MSRKELPLDPEPASTARNMPRELRAPCWRLSLGYFLTPLCYNSLQLLTITLSLSLNGQVRLVDSV